MPASKACCAAPSARFSMTSRLKAGAKSTSRSNAPTPKVPDLFLGAPVKRGSGTGSCGMSLRLQLLQVARLAPRLLADSTELVRNFYARQFDENGAACDRAGKPDLYYTIFALAGAQTLDVPIPADRTRAWLESFEDGDSLDFVHRGALARCWAAIGGCIIGTKQRNSLQSRKISTGRRRLQFQRLRRLWHGLRCASSLSALTKISEQSRPTC